MTPPPLTSRQSSSTKTFRTKFEVSYQALLAGEYPWQGLSSSASSSSLNGSGTPLGSSYSNGSTSYFSSNNGKKPSAPRARYFADLLCLKVESSKVNELVQRIPFNLLLEDDEGSKGARIRENIGSLWRECLRIWTDVEKDDGQSLGSPLSPSRAETTSDEVRRFHAVETLLVLSRATLAKRTPTQAASSLDLIWIFAGGIDEADDVFEALVAAIDEGLNGELDRPQQATSAGKRTVDRNAQLPGNVNLPTLSQYLQHRLKAVQLAIVWITHVSSTNLAAYFVRRDLFASTCTLLSELKHIRDTSKRRELQGHGALAEADDDLLRDFARDCLLLLGLLAGLGHAGASGSSASVSSSYSSTSTASHSPYYRRLCDWQDMGAMDLLQQAASYEFEKSWTAFDEMIPNGSGASSNASMLWLSTPSMGVISESAKMLGWSAGDDAKTASSGVSNDLPLASTCVLLPVYMLLRANQGFIKAIFAEAEHDAKEKGKGRQSFATSLLSLCSYLATHASTSERSRSYSRLSMLTLLALLSSEAAVHALLLEERAEDAKLVKTCRHRAGPRSGKTVEGTTQEGGMLGALFSHLPLASTEPSSMPSSRLLSYVLDASVQFLRHNLRKRLDVAGYLICLENIKQSISCCSKNKQTLVKYDWREVWRSLQTVAVFLVGRHGEIRGAEIGRLGRLILSTFAYATRESDQVLASRTEIDDLLYELVRGSEALRALACITVTGKATLQMNADDPGKARLEAEKIVSSIPGWRLVDLVLLGFENELQTWRNKKGAAGSFQLSMDLSSLTGGYFGKTSKGDATVASSSSSTSMPNVETVKSLLHGLDIGKIIAMDDDLGRSRDSSSSKAALLHEDWLERIESQCLAEAFRCASDDMRSLV